MDQHRLRAGELLFGGALEDAGEVARVFAAGGSEDDGVGGVVNEQGAGTAIGVIDAEEDELGVDAVGNAFGLSKRARARPSSRRSRRSVADLKREPRPTLSLAGNMLCAARWMAANTLPSISVR